MLASESKEGLHMNWNADKSVRLSQVCVCIFAALLLALDIGCYWAVRWFIGMRHMSSLKGNWMMLTIYLCSIFAWILLVKLWRLLWNIQSGRVFDEENVRLLRAVSHCCVGAGVICAASCWYYLPFIMVAIAAGFMALIVRIVKNVFQQAIAMKSELDFTV